MHRIVHRFLLFTVFVTAFTVFGGIQRLEAQSYSIEYCLECGNSEFKRFRDSITVTSGMGENWSVVGGSVVGFYTGVESSTLVSGALSGSGTMYVLNGWKDSDSNYTLQVTNGETTLIIVPTQTCSFPDDRIYGDDDVCVNSTHSYYLNIPNSDIIMMEWSISGMGGTFQENGDFTIMNNSNAVTINWGGIAGTFILSIMGLVDPYGCMIDTSIMVEVLDQEDLDISMACNDVVHFSLEDNCEGIITPDLILEGDTLGNSSYDVILWDPDDNSVIPDARLTRDYLGEKIRVSIEHECSGNSCWGYVLVEDKMPPQFENCIDGFLPDITIDCTDDPDPDNGPTLYPEVFDNCDPLGVQDISYTDEVTVFFCENDYDSMIKRTWMATDSYGNKATCMQLIYVHRTTLDQIVFPGDTILPCDIVLVDGEPVPGDEIIYLDNGKPSPETTGKPVNVTCKNILYDFQDVCFDLCGNSLKVFRTWSVIDWCTGLDTIVMQVIKIEDNAPPIVSCVQDTLRYPTDPGKCTGTILRLPDPELIIDCSPTSYTIAYKLRDENGDPFEEPITDNVIDNGDGTYGIADLPLDTTWVIYTITDECGNSTQCFTEVIIVDDESPSTICETHTVISLDEMGYAKLQVESLDDHSYDNCGIDHFEAKRKKYPEQDNCYHPEDFEFGDLIHFCCADLGKVIDVSLRVYDIHGNFSDCHVFVTVQDKIPPVVYCPPSFVYLDCVEDYTDIHLTGGSPFVEDNCPDNIEITFHDYPDLNDCGVGTVDRVWYIEDGSATNYCYQSIVIEGEVFDHYDIHFPPDKTIYGCSADDADPVLTGKPYIKPGKGECVNVHFTYDDQLFYDLDGFCMKLIRTWTAINWCDYSSYVPYGGAFWTHVQKIILHDYEPPVFISNCYDRTVESNQPNCQGYVELKAEAIDNCSGIIKYSYEIDLHYEPYTGFQPGPKVQGSSASGVYPGGTHRIRFYAQDLCGNIAYCDFNFTIKDSKPPTAACIGKINFPLQYNQEVTIWASEFDASSYDQCNGTDLIFSFSPNTFDQSKTFDCSDLATNGAWEEIPLQVWVSDLDGNQSFCEVKVVVADNKDVCPDFTGGESGNVSGLILNESREGIEELEVSISHVRGEMEKKVMTSRDGSYAFDNLPLYNDYMIKPRVETFGTDGVSTLDLVLIQKHILGVKHLDSPYKIIAADVNRSGSLSALDLLILRKLILGVDHYFEDNDSWRFIDAGHEFPDQLHPQDYPEYKMFESLFLGENQADFIAIKVGDVNNSASLNRINQPEVRYSDYLNLVITEKEQSGGLMEYIVSSDEWIHLHGMQMTLQFPAEQYQMVRVEGDAVQLESGNLGWTMVDRGLVAISWNVFDPLYLGKGTNLFRIYLKPKTNEATIDKPLEFSSEILSMEAYDKELNILGLQVRYENKEIIPEGSGFVLEQNYPNPFQDKTTISFRIPEPGQVRLHLLDLSGRLLHSQSSLLEAGVHTMTLDLEAILDPGLYYYQLESGNYTETRRMIKIR